MRSLDTSVLARFLVRDDPEQTAIADKVMRSDVMVTVTVLLETAWLLASRFGLSRSAVANGLIQVLDIDTVTLHDESLVRWAIDRLIGGADFADMLHLVASRDASYFTTFDQALARDAGPATPIIIETLQA